MKQALNHCQDIPSLCLEYWLHSLLISFASGSLSLRHSEFISLQRKKGSFSLPASVEKNPKEGFWLAHLMSHASLLSLLPEGEVPGLTQPGKDASLCGQNGWELLLKEGGNGFWPGKIIVITSPSIFGDQRKLIWRMRNRSQIICIMKTSKKERNQEEQGITLCSNAVKRIL